MSQRVKKPGRPPATSSGGGGGAEEGQASGKGRQRRRRPSEPPDPSGSATTGAGGSTSGGKLSIPGEDTAIPSTSAAAIAAASASAGPTGTTTRSAAAAAAGSSNSSSLAAAVAAVAGTSSSTSVSALCLPGPSSQIASTSAAAVAAAVAAAAAAAAACPTAGTSTGGPTTSSGLTGMWTPRHLNDLKVSSIYNRNSAEAPAELYRKDLISAMKLPDSEPLTPEEYWLIMDSWKQEWEKGVQVPVNPESLPEPEVKLITPVSERSHDFRLPKKKYVRVTHDDFFNPDYHQLVSTAARAEKVCSYDLDDVDAAWLGCCNADRAMQSIPMISEFLMEQVVEELELQCWEQVQTILKSQDNGLGIEYDENVICDVCRSPESEEGNEMVFCDSCNICVHQACYGITTIPSGSWLCKTCTLGIKPACVLCPNMGGAMKATRSGHTWAHVACAIWIPEVSIGSVEKMEPITKISSIPQSRWSLVCVLCKEKQGACIQCSVKTCKTAYHVTCAFKNGLEMKPIIVDENAEDGIKLRSYCQKHSVNTKKGKQRQQAAADKQDKPEEEKVVGVGVGSKGKKKEAGAADKVGKEKEAEGTGGAGADLKKKVKAMTAEERNQVRQEKLQLIESEFFKYVRLKDVSQNLAVDMDVVIGIYNYWKLKRKSLNNRPLVPPRPETTQLLTQQQEQDLEQMKMFVQLRQDLERVRNLCYMVSRREKLSRSYFKLKEQTWQKQVEILTEFPPGELKPEELDAVKRANKGGGIYDQFYSENRDVVQLPDYEKLIEVIAGGLEAKKEQIMNGIIGRQGGGAQKGRKKKAQQEKEEPHPGTSQKGVVAEGKKQFVNGARQKKGEVGAKVQGKKGGKAGAQKGEGEGDAKKEKKSPSPRGRKGKQGAAAAAAAAAATAAAVAAVAKVEKTVAAEKARKGKKPLAYLFDSDSSEVENDKPSKAAAAKGKKGVKGAKAQQQQQQEKRGKTPERAVAAQQQKSGAQQKGKRELTKSPVGKKGGKTQQQAQAVVKTSYLSDSDELELPAGRAASSGQKQTKDKPIYSDSEEEVKPEKKLLLPPPPPPVAVPRRGAGRGSSASRSPVGRGRASTSPVSRTPSPPKRSPSPKRQKLIERMMRAGTGEPALVVLAANQPFPRPQLMPGEEALPQPPFPRRPVPLDETEEFLTSPEKQREYVRTPTPDRLEKEERRRRANEKAALEKAEEKKRKEEMRAAQRQKKNAAKKAAELIVPQREAAKKATESIRSVKQKQKEKEDREREEKEEKEREEREKDKVPQQQQQQQRGRKQAKSPGKSPERKKKGEGVLAQQQREQQRRVARREEPEEDEEEEEAEQEGKKEPEKKKVKSSSAEQVSTYVPQRQAAKKAAEHIRSGLSNIVAARLIIEDEMEATRKKAKGPPPGEKEEKDGSSKQAAATPATAPAAASKGGVRQQGGKAPAKEHLAALSVSAPVPSRSSGALDSPFLDKGPQSSALGRRSRERSCSSSSSGSSSSGTGSGSSGSSSGSGSGSSSSGSSSSCSSSRSSSAASTSRSSSSSAESATPQPRTPVKATPPAVVKEAVPAHGPGRKLKTSERVPPSATPTAAAAAATAARNSRPAPPVRAAAGGGEKPTPKIGRPPKSGGRGGADPFRSAFSPSPEPEPKPESQSIKGSPHKQPPSNENKQRGQPAPTTPTKAPPGPRAASGSPVKAGPGSRASRKREPSPVPTSGKGGAAAAAKQKASLKRTPSPAKSTPEKRSPTKAAAALGKPKAPQITGPQLSSESESESTPPASTQRPPATPCPQRKTPERKQRPSSDRNLVLSDSESEESGTEEKENTQQQKEQNAYQSVASSPKPTPAATPLPSKPSTPAHQQQLPQHQQQAVQQQRANATPTHQLPISQQSVLSPLTPTENKEKDPNSVTLIASTEQPDSKRPRLEVPPPATLPLQTPTAANLKSIFSPSSHADALDFDSELYDLAKSVVGGVGDEDEVGDTLHFNFPSHLFHAEDNKEDSARATLNLVEKLRLQHHQHAHHPKGTPRQSTDSQSENEDSQLISPVGSRPGSGLHNRKRSVSPKESGTQDHQQRQLLQSPELVGQKQTIQGDERWVPPSPAGAGGGVPPTPHHHPMLQSPPLSSPKAGHKSPGKPGSISGSMESLTSPVTPLVPSPMVSPLLQQQQQPARVGGPGASPYNPAAAALAAAMAAAAASTQDSSPNNFQAAVAAAAAAGLPFGAIPPFMFGPGGLANNPGFASVLAAAAAANNPLAPFLQLPTQQQAGPPNKASSSVAPGPTSPFSTAFMPPPQQQQSSVMSSVSSQPPGCSPPTRRGSDSAAVSLATSMPPLAKPPLTSPSILLSASNCKSLVTTPPLQSAVAHIIESVVNNHQASSALPKTTLSLDMALQSPKAPVQPSPVAAVQPVPVSIPPTTQTSTKTPLSSPVLQKPAQEQQEQPLPPQQKVQAPEVSPVVVPAAPAAALPPPPPPPPTTTLGRGRRASTPRAVKDKALTGVNAVIEDMLGPVLPAPPTPAGKGRGRKASASPGAGPGRGKATAAAAAVLSPVKRPAGRGRGKKKDLIGVRKDLAGTVYDIDFDEFEEPDPQKIDLRSLRERRKSSEVAAAQLQQQQQSPLVLTLPVPGGKKGKQSKEEKRAQKQQAKQQKKQDKKQQKQDKEKVAPLVVAPLKINLGEKMAQAQAQEKEKQQQQQQQMLEKELATPQKSPAALLQAPLPGPVDMRTYSAGGVVQPQTGGQHQVATSTTSTSGGTVTVQEGSAAGGAAATAAAPEVPAQAPVKFTIPSLTKDPGSEIASLFGLTEPVSPPTTGASRTSVSLQSITLSASIQQTPPIPSTTPLVVNDFDEVNKALDDLVATKKQSAPQQPTAHDKPSLATGKESLAPLPPKKEASSAQPPISPPTLHITTTTTENQLLNGASSSSSIVHSHLAPPQPQPNAPLSALAQQANQHQLLHASSVSGDASDISRNQLKVKIKGPFLDANYSSTSHTTTATSSMHHHPPAAPPHHLPYSHLHPPPNSMAAAVQSVYPTAASSFQHHPGWMMNSGGTPSMDNPSNLRRMRKKELLRKYWNEDMNMDGAPSAQPPPQPTPSHYHPHHHDYHRERGEMGGGLMGHGHHGHPHHPLGRSVITIPKAVASMSMPLPSTQDDQDAQGGDMAGYDGTDPLLMGMDPLGDKDGGKKPTQKKRRSRGIYREMAALGILPPDAQPRTERRRKEDKLGAGGQERQQQGSGTSPGGREERGGDSNSRKRQRENKKPSRSTFIPPTLVEGSDSPNAEPGTGSQKNKGVVNVVNAHPTPKLKIKFGELQSGKGGVASPAVQAAVGAGGNHLSDSDKETPNKKAKGRPPKKRVLPTTANTQGAEGGQEGTGQHSGSTGTPQLQKEGQAGGSTGSGGAGGSGAAQAQPTPMEEQMELLRRESLKFREKIMADYAAQEQQAILKLSGTRRSKKQKRRAGASGGPSEASEQEDGGAATDASSVRSKSPAEIKIIDGPKPKLILRFGKKKGRKEKLKGEGLEGGSGTTSDNSCSSGRNSASLSVAGSQNGVAGGVVLPEEKQNGPPTGPTGPVAAENNNNNDNNKEKDQVASQQLVATPQEVRNGGGPTTPAVPGEKGKVGKGKKAGDKDKDKTTDKPYTPIKLKLSRCFEGSYSLKKKEAAAGAAAKGEIPETSTGPPAAAASEASAEVGDKEALTPPTTGQKEQAGLVR